jgi:hypothetical protein
MNRAKQIILLVAILTTTLFNSAAQEKPEKIMWDKGNVEDQFEYVFDKASKYEDYKVIKLVNLNALRAHVLDSLKGVKKKLRETQKVVLDKDIQINSLKTQLQAINDQLATVIKEKNTISFLGISMAKPYYNSLIWTIIIGLFTMMSVFIFLFRRSNIVTTETKASLLETKQELEAHRKRALEREEKLSRKYLDELNKYKQQINSI